MSFLSFIAGLGAPLALLLAMVGVFKLTTIRVEDEEAILVTKFGKLVDVLKRPGLHLRLDRFLPWVEIEHVSLARDFRELVGVHVHDAQGTTVLVDIWLEIRVVDPVKTRFAVEDWDLALRNLVSHAVTSIFGNKRFEEILRARVELTPLLEAEIADDLARWGIRLEQAYLRDLGVRPEVERQILAGVSARLERAMADVEERGRLAVARIEAETSVQVAELVARAKSQYPEAVGRAYEKLGTSSAVRAAYDELYGLTQIRPQRTTAFVGFGGDLRAVDAMMIPVEGRLEPSAAAPRPNGEPAAG